jgi:acyl dehydratase
VRGGASGSEPPPRSAEAALEGLDPAARLRLLFGLLPAIGQPAGRVARVHVTSGEQRLTITSDGQSLGLEPGHSGTPSSRLVADPAALWDLVAGQADGPALFAAARVSTDGMEDLLWLIAAAPKARAEVVAEIAARGTGISRAAVGKLYHGDPVIVKADDMVQFAVATSDDSPHHLDRERPGGIVAPPLFPVKYCNQMYFQLVADSTLGIDLSRLLFGEMDMRFLAPVRPRDLVVAKSRVIGIDDKDTGQVLTVRTRLLCDGLARCEADASFFLRWARKGRLKPVKGKDGGAPPSAVAFEDAMRSREDQTNLFAKAADDPNPIHVEDNFAKAAGLPGRILHGLCIMSFCGQAFVRRAGAGDPARLVRLKARFAKPAYPGQTITTRAFAPETKDGILHYRFIAQSDTGETVITGGEAELRA